MTDTTVRRLTEEDWRVYRQLRLSALQESPDAFVRTFAEEKDYDEALWRARMRRAERLVAAQSEELVGVLSMRPADEEFDEGSAELFGLWVKAELRGTGVALELFKEAVREARADGHGHLVYWVGTDNARAVGFASGRGFRPSEQRRAMHGPGSVEGDEEIAMVLSLT